MQSCIAVPFSPHFSQDDEVIAKSFGLSGNFLDEWNNSVYCRGEENYL